MSCHECEKERKKQGEMGTRSESERKNKKVTEEGKKEGGRRGGEGQRVRQRKRRWSDGL